MLIVRYRPLKVPSDTAKAHAARCAAGTAPEQHILPSFVEDGVPGLPSLRDFLFSVHKAVLVKS